jgi:sulfatase modifying factor 1
VSPPDAPRVPTKPPSRIHGIREGILIFGVFILATGAPPPASAQRGVEGSGAERSSAGRTGACSRVGMGVPDAIPIPAGEFVMGSGAEESERARGVCERESAGSAALLSWRCAGLLSGPESPPPGSLCEGQNLQHATYREVGRHRVLLGAFALDRTEVTEGAYARCVEAGGCPSIALGPESSSDDARSLPMVGVTWYEARTFCGWARGRLPTEAEWERAARGRDGRSFPWGNQLNPRLANLGAPSASCRSILDGFEYRAPVGSFLDGASPDGLLDLAGNVAEWVDDGFDEGPEDPRTHRLDWTRSRARYRPNERVVNPRGLAATGDLRVVRGGSFAGSALVARTVHRVALAAGERRPWLGFRCAYDRS